MRKGNMTSLFDMHSTLRTPIYSFMPLTDILSMSLVNRSLRCESPVDLFKKHKAVTIFDALYHPAFETFALKHYYFESAATYVKQVFYLIPELFELIQGRNCKHIMFCILHTCRVEKIAMHYPGDCSALLSLILDKIRDNTTLLSCNLGLFAHLLRREELEQILVAHPTLECISLYNGEDGPALHKTSVGVEWR